ncbi:MAG: hypothetical protein KJZ83_00400 [Burkholderiaceae bacterium]|nr:hypothetical protein [Burkholderiaceae bacterium]
MRESLVYALADSLNMKIELQSAEPQLRGEKQFNLEIGGLSVPIKVKIVSALLNNSNHMIIVKVMGNLALLMIAGNDRNLKTQIEVHVLNLAKMGQVKGWLERNQSATSAGARSLLDKAIVKSFDRRGKAKWTAAA